MLIVKCQVAILLSDKLLVATKQYLCAIIVASACLFWSEYDCV